MTIEQLEVILVNLAEGETSPEEDREIMAAFPVLVAIAKAAKEIHLHDGSQYSYDYDALKLWNAREALHDGIIALADAKS